MSWFSDIGDAIGDVVSTVGNAASSVGSFVGQEVKQAADYVAPALPSILNAASVIAPFTGIGAIASPFLKLGANLIQSNQTSARPQVSAAVMPPQLLQQAQQASFQTSQNNVAQVPSSNPVQNAAFGNSTPYASASYIAPAQTSQPSTGSVGFFDNVKSFFSNNPWYVIFGVVVIPAGLVLFLLFKLFTRKRR